MRNSSKKNLVSAYIILLYTFVTSNTELNGPLDCLHKRTVLCSRWKCEWWHKWTSVKCVFSSFTFQTSQPLNLTQYYFAKIKRHFDENTSFEENCFAIIFCLMNSYCIFSNKYNMIVKINLFLLKWSKLCFFLENPELK